jgi:glycosyltransferase involved in cell wall biosynthesis
VKRTVPERPPGVPVVGSAVEGLPMTLGRGRGVRVPPDDPAALALALEDVMSGNHSVDLSAAAEYAQRFSPARVTAVYASAGSSLATTRASRTG